MLGGLFRNRSDALRVVLRHSHQRSIFHRKYSQRHDPLNILFCGADEFSIASLRSLYHCMERNPSRIRSIEVLCRPDKRVGRGRKQIQQVPIKKEAKSLNLDLHQIDTFIGWQPPLKINLVVTVSFGLLVPAKVLNGAKYGGLNVHPSMLPDLRGSAPIVHALLKQRSHTGVSVQTMHPTRFDHGTILAQTPSPGIPIPPECSLHDLLANLSFAGAEMLCQVIETDLFLSPISEIDQFGKNTQLDHATKIVTEDKHIDWNSWPAEKILLYGRVLGRLWDTKTYTECNGMRKAAKRVTFGGPWVVATDFQAAGGTSNSKPGQPVAISDPATKQVRLGFHTVDNRLVVPANATIEGEPKDGGISTLTRALQASQNSSP